MKGMVCGGWEGGGGGCRQNTGPKNKPQKQKKEKTEGAAGQDRITRKQIERWNQTTAARFQTGGRHQKSPASLSGRLIHNTHITATHPYYTYSTVHTII